MEWLDHPLSKHPLTIILVVAVLLVAGYFAFSPYERCARSVTNAEWSWKKNRHQVIRDCGSGSW